MSTMNQELSGAYICEMRYTYRIEGTLFIYLFIYLFIFGCVGFSLLCAGFL